MIDNDDSRDLDQLSVAGPLAGGVKILVAVADVDATVKDGSANDGHAVVVLTQPDRQHREHLRAWVLDETGLAKTPSESPTLCSCRTISPFSGRGWSDSPGPSTTGPSGSTLTDQG